MRDAGPADNAAVPTQADAAQQQTNKAAGPATRETEGTAAQPADPPAIDPAPDPADVQAFEASEALEALIVAAQAVPAGEQAVAALDEAIAETVNAAPADAPVAPAIEEIKPNTPATNIPATMPDAAPANPTAAPPKAEPAAVAPATVPPSTATPIVATPVNALPTEPIAPAADEDAASSGDHPATVTSDTDDGAPVLATTPDASADVDRKPRPEFLQPASRAAPGPARLDLAADGAAAQQDAGNVDVASADADPKPLQAPSTSAEPGARGGEQRAEPVNSQLPQAQTPQAGAQAHAAPLITVQTLGAPASIQGIAHTASASAFAATAPASSAVPVEGIAIEIAVHAQLGRHRFEIRLNPPELGRIDVRLDIDAEGRVTSRLVIDRAETLEVLRRDAAQLERALQQAGLKTGDGSLQFQLRDQSFAAGRQDEPPAQDAAQLVAADSDLPASEAVQGYGRLIGLGGGLDIRV